MANQNEKELAGRAAAELVVSGNIVGLGTGSTAYFAVVALGERVKAGLKIIGIPTSVATADLARTVGIPLTTLDEHPEIDITIDGADEADPQLRLIKGGGGALLREKIIATASKRMIVVADSSKLVSALGKFPLPVEVIPFAQAVVAKKISALGASCKLRNRLDGMPFVTDEGHHILDCSFGEITDPPALARTLSDMPGVVEHGLFIGIAKMALVGKGSGVVEIRAGSAQPGKVCKKPTRVKRTIRKKALRKRSR
ncbi:MAG TPA: ribose-5-phosphate isomerase RpiA [Terriglobales bacterium]|jgi:ribose 5-phosphate isomerase A|nr:ribose-5-phosphate isomerase RpiA [Terriglobales bacterium]